MRESVLTDVLNMMTNYHKTELDVWIGILLGSEEKGSYSTFRLNDACFPFHTAYHIKVVLVLWKVKEMYLHVSFVDL